MLLFSPVMQSFPNLPLALPEFFKLYAWRRLSLWQWRRIICSQSSQEYIFISVKTNYVFDLLWQKARGRHYHAYKHVVHLCCSLIQKLAAAWTHTRTCTSTQSYRLWQLSQSHIWKWRGVAGQVEHSLVKKSIKMKQSSKELYPLAASSLLQPSWANVGIIYRHGSVGGKAKQAYTVGIHRIKTICQCQS